MLIELFVEDKGRDRNKRLAIHFSIKLQFRLLIRAYGRAGDEGNVVKLFLMSLLILSLSSRFFTISYKLKLEFNVN